MLFKGFFFGVALSALGVASTQAGAADFDPVTGMPFYVSVFAGGSSLRDVPAILQTAIGSGYHYSVESKSGYLLGGAFGASLNDYIRGEVELSHSRWKAHGYSVSYMSSLGSVGTTSGEATGPLSTTYLLANVWFDLKNESMITPYVGGGLGLGWAKADAEINGGAVGLGGSDSGFAYQLGGGVKFDLSEHLALDAGYRYKVLDNLSLKESAGTGDFKNVDFRSHNIQVGLTYKF